MGRTYRREIERLLRDAGCRFVRYGKGDDEIWYSPLTKRHFVFDRGVAIRHTANGILKDAGLPKAFGSWPLARYPGLDPGSIF